MKQPNKVFCFILVLIAQGRNKIYHKTFNNVQEKSNIIRKLSVILAVMAMILIMIMMVVVIMMMVK